jgi:transposase-like protein
MDLARYVVDAVVLEGRSYRDIARAHGVSKSWVGKVVGQFREGGYHAIAPRSRAPKQVLHRTSPEIEDEIVALRKELVDLGLDAGPSRSTTTLPCATVGPVGLNGLAGALSERVRDSAATQAAAELLGALRGAAADAGSPM